MHILIAAEYFTQWQVLKAISACVDYICVYIFDDDRDVCVCVCLNIHIHNMSFICVVYGDFHFLHL